MAGLFVATSVTVSFAMFSPEAALAQWITIVTKKSYAATML
jgi:hypothetical protein